MKNIVFNPTKAGEQLDFTIQRASNGGFVIWQKDSHAAVMDNIIGAFTDAEDMMAALSAYFTDHE